MIYNISLQQSVPSVRGFLFKDLKQCLRKEHCDVSCLDIFSSLTRNLYDRHDRNSRFLINLKVNIVVFLSYYLKELRHGLCILKNLA